MNNMSNGDESRARSTHDAMRKLGSTVYIMRKFQALKRDKIYITILCALAAAGCM
jgi:hypothetical protein